MKTPSAATLCLLFLFLGNCLSAQNIAEFSQAKPEKVKLFDRLPTRFSLSTATVASIFSLNAKSKIVLPIDGNNFFEGSVLEKVVKNEQLTSVNIRFSNFDGALLTLSRIANPGEAVSYIGRLVNVKYGDAYMVIMKGSEMLFSKQKQSTLVAE